MSWLRKLLFRVRADEMGRELRFHLDRLIEDNIKTGMNPKEARNAALRAFGGVEQIRAHCRDAQGARLIETLEQDLRYALRMMRATPGFSSVAVLILALGIGANSAIFSVINAVLLRALPYHEPERIMRVNEADERGSGQGVAPPNFVDWREQNHSFEQLAAYTRDQFVLTRYGEAQRVEGAQVSANLFSLLGVNAALGRAFTDEEGRPGAVKVPRKSPSGWRSGQIGPT